MDNFIKIWNEIPVTTKFTVFTSIATFGFGFIINESIKAITRYRERKTFRKSFFFILKDFSNACLKQSATIKRSLANTGFTHDKDFILDKETLASLNYLTSINLQNLIAILNKQFKHKLHNKALSRLITLIHQVNENNLYVKETLVDMNSRFREHEGNYQKALGKLRDKHDEFLIKLNIGQLPNDLKPFATSFIKVFIDWHKAGQNVAFNTTFNTIILPLKEICKRSTNLNLLDLMQLTMEAEIAYINIEKIEAHLVQTAKNSSYVHLKAYKLIPLIVSILR